LLRDRIRHRTGDHRFHFLFVELGSLLHDGTGLRHPAQLRCILLLGKLLGCLHHRACQNSKLLDLRGRLIHGVDQLVFQSIVYAAINGGK
jgi:hypothetical protein